MTTYDPRTGRFSLAPDSLRVLDDQECAQTWTEAQEPCACPIDPGPHVHAPNAYPGFDNGHEVWLGG